MTTNAQPGPFYLVQYTNINECRITAVMTQAEYEGQDEPADFYNVKILCKDLPPGYAAAPQLLAALKAVVIRWEGTPLDQTPREVRDARAVIAQAEGKV